MSTSTETADLEQRARDFRLKKIADGIYGAWYGLWTDKGVANFVRAELEAAAQIVEVSGHTPSQAADQIRERQR